MAQFARDLGEVFEDHFVRAVTLLSSVVAEHNDVSVIEVRLQFWFQSSVQELTRAVDVQLRCISTEILISLTCS